MHRYPAATVEPTIQHPYLRYQYAVPAYSLTSNLCKTVFTPYRLQCSLQA